MGMAEPSHPGHHWPIAQQEKVLTGHRMGEFLSAFAGPLVIVPVFLHYSGKASTLFGAVNILIAHYWTYFYCPGTTLDKNARASQTAGRNGKATHKGENAILHCFCVATKCHQQDHCHCQANQLALVAAAGWQDGQAAHGWTLPVSTWD